MPRGPSINLTQCSSLASAIAQGAGAGDAGSVIFWSAVLIALMVLGFIVVAAVKKRVNDDDPDDNPRASAGFTLSDLRQLHREGKITPEEFVRAKGKIVDAAKRASERESQAAAEDET